MTSAVRILVNAIHAKAGGGRTYLRQLLPVLARDADLDIHVIPPSGEAARFAALAPRLTIHTVAVPRGWLRLLAWEQLVLPWVARRIGYDVMFSPANFAPLLARNQVIVLQNALTVGRLETRLGLRLYWAALRLMTRLSLARARAAIAVSRYAAATATTRWLPQRTPTIVHHGVDPAFTPLLENREEGLQLLAVGDLYIQKNFTTLVEAVAILRQTHPNLRLEIAGDAIDREYADRLHRLVSRLGLGDAVRFRGRLPPAELIALYRSCAVFVFPSLEESFGMPLVEAMACGAPVVAAATAATPEITGDAALLCDATAPAPLAAAIGRVLDDPALRGALRHRSLERARAFSWDDCARRTAAVLRQAAG